MPKLSIIILTIPERANFLKQSEKYLARQTYQDFEVIVNRDTGIIAKKRNDAIRQSKCDKIMMWDDDDWFSKERVEKQFQAISYTGKKIVFTSFFYTWVCANQYAKEYHNIYYGGPIAFHKSLWEEYPYREDLLYCEDGDFLTHHLHADPSCVVDLHDPTYMVYVFHGSNTTGLPGPGGLRRKTRATRIVKGILGPDLKDIQSLRLIKGVQGKAEEHIQWLKSQ